MKTISPEAAIKEVATYCNSLEYIEYRTVVDFVSMYFDIVEKEHHTFLISEVINFLETNIDLIIPYPSDVVRIENELSRIARLHGKYVMRKDGRNRIFEPLLKAKTVELPKPNIKLNYIKTAPTEVIEEETDKGALIENTIDEYLESLKGKAISHNDYYLIVKKLRAFFEDKNPDCRAPYFIAKGGKTKLASYLGIIFKKLKSEPLSYDYFAFCRRLFSCFAQEEIEQMKLNKSPMYKNFTRKTQ